MLKAIINFIKRLFGKQSVEDPPESSLNHMSGGFKDDIDEEKEEGGHFENGESPRTFKEDLE